MKNIHLICNAHIDPVWQWNWQEGASAALATFKSAVQLCDEFDYIFCHGEVTLYKFIEEYAPELFAEIKRLVKAGKWRITGGWYLQPDCVMPSGESITRQILLGKKYFKEKFGVEPETATNYDSFGHSRGIVQIMVKCGQTSYITCRPNKSQLPLEKELFYWEGFDGSRVKVYRSAVYNSPLGKAVEHIKQKISETTEQTVCVLWGVGNHGGGPSIKDLNDIELLINSASESIEHSYPEKFFAQAVPECTVKTSLLTAMPGGYTSLSNIKKKHIQLENELYTAEKICTAAALSGKSDYPETALTTAAEDLMNGEFHDILPGTVVRSGEESALGYFYHGILEAEQAKMKAFYSLLKNKPTAREGEYPIFVFNYQPYERTENVECEFMLKDQNWDEKNVSHLTVKDEKGNTLPCQVVKEESNLNLDWRKKVVFEGKLKPFSINRFSVEVCFKETKNAAVSKNTFYASGDKYAEIDRETGTLKSFALNGKEYISNGFLPIMYEDNADPWAMQDYQQRKLGTSPQPFVLESGGIFGDADKVRVTFDGDIYLAAECFFKKDNSRIRTEYKIYKNNSYIDVNVDVFWQDKDKILKLEIPVTVKGEFIGQTVFGTDTLFIDGRECAAQRFVAVDCGEYCLAVLNDCSYGVSFENGKIYLSLVRGISYCAHPIPNISSPIISDTDGGIRELIPSDKFVKKGDIAERNFSFRIAVCKREELERLASEFNEKPFTLNAFPLGGEDINNDFDFSADNKNVVLKAFKKSETGEGYIIRLFNNFHRDCCCSVNVNGAKKKLSFGSYEVKTLNYVGGKLLESEKMLI